MFSALLDILISLVHILLKYWHPKDQIYHFKELKESPLFTELWKVQVSSKPPNIFKWFRGTNDSRNYEVLRLPSWNENRFKNFKNFSTKTKCKTLICGPGRIKIYGEIAGGYGWRCDLCPVNHYKSAVGDNGCLPCRGQFSIDNGQRTKCVDPYRDVYPNTMEQTLSKIMISLAIVGILATILNLSIFIVKRKTPVVASSDFIASTIHLIIIITINLMAIILQFLDPSENVCILRVSTISISYALSISFMFVKSQKLLQAFLSKVPITLEEARKTVSLQIVTVLTSVLIVCGLIVVVFKQKNAFSIFQDHSNMERIYFCDTSFHVNVVIGFIMVIQFACSCKHFVEDIYQV